VLTYFKRRSKIGKKPKQKELILGFKSKETAQEWESLLRRYGDQRRLSSLVEKPSIVDTGGRLGERLVSGGGSHQSEVSQSQRQPDSPAVRFLAVSSS
jgi:hypothetical protein